MQTMTRHRDLRRRLGPTLDASALDSAARLAGGTAGMSMAAGITLPHRDPAANRIAVVMLRGGMDGLFAVPAIGDPDFATTRGALARYPTPPLPLDGFFALHPALAQLHAMYGAGELLVVHAAGIAGAGRSHLDAQRLLETGGMPTNGADSGWLGRALAGSPRKALALNPIAPLLLRGGAPVDTWAPPSPVHADADLIRRLSILYAADPLLAPALARATSESGSARSAVGQVADTQFVALAQRAAAFLALDDGPHAAVLEMSGWDSHADQADPHGAPTVLLQQLDAGLAALRSGLVASGAWQRTIVVVATEFGRSVAANDTLGTEHGSASVAWLLGGAVRGGRVLADWPGLAQSDLVDGRDLRITTDLRALFKGVLADHLRLPHSKIDGEVFPGSTQVAALASLCV